MTPPDLVEKLGPYDAFGLVRQVASWSTIELGSLLVKLEVLYLLEISMLISQPKFLETCNFCRKMSSACYTHE
jgi:hypothetical protein